MLGRFLWPRIDRRHRSEPPQPCMIGKHKHFLIAATIPVRKEYVRLLSAKPLL